MRVLLRRGELVAQDSKTSLLARYPYRTLRVCLDRAEYTLPENLVPLLVAADDTVLTFRLHRSEQQIGQVLTALQGAGLCVVDLNTEEAGLEEVFLALTGETSEAGA